MSRPHALPCLLLLVLAAPALAGPRVGIEAGFNAGTLTYQSGSFVFDPGYQPSWSLGMTLEAPMGSHVSLVSGARYIEYGEKMGIHITDALGTQIAGSNLHTVFRYASIPALLRYRPVARSGFFLTGGSEFGWLADIAQHVSDTGTYAMSVPGIRAATARANGEPVGAPKFIDFFERWNVSLSGGLGWEFPLGAHRAIGELRYTQGLTDIAKGANVERTTRGFESLLGLTW